MNESKLRLSEKTDSNRANSFSNHGGRRVIGSAKDLYRSEQEGDMMGRLNNITLEELHEVREQTEGEKPRERVLAAIGRKQGAQIDTLAERHGIVEKTIRNWLDRLLGKPIEQAPYDAPRPGGPSKLTSKQREHLEEVLQDSPTELGYDQQAWSPKLLLHYVAREYDVEYSKRHARYLLTEAALSWRTARHRSHEADPEGEAEFQATVQKNAPN